ncbi:winged helix-turn-helix domain-containing protein [Horticoccus sp. 23ND18S-11]|uniref:winged helix-turn-helix domain-containing protein n=1 Tax=Horticoccus sp. 23ND18S-11 TaxID=3391832 RepID=UPI0039C9AF11
MIIIASSVPTDAAALIALCESGGWSANLCTSVRAVVRQVHREVPRVIVVRQRLEDGYSDDVIGALTELKVLSRLRLVVLVNAGTAVSSQARQVALGADCVLRDPVSADLLLAYLSKYFNETKGNHTAPLARKVSFAGATWQASECKLTYEGRHVVLTPREKLLLELLAHSGGEVVSYEKMFGEVLGRRYQGDTSNMRVLLGRLSVTMGNLGIALRDWIQVLPKTGYRYRQ